VSSGECTVLGGGGGGGAADEGLAGFPMASGASLVLRICLLETGEATRLD
jgi:hypothetical protein